MKSFFSSLRVRILSIIILIMIPPFIGAMFMINTEKELAIQRYKEEAAQLVQMVSAGQEQNIRDTHRLLANLANGKYIQNHDYDYIKEILDAFIQHYNRYTMIAIVDPSGNIIYNTLRSTVFTNIADRPYFKETLDSRQFTIGEYQICRLSYNPTLVLSLPVLDKAGDIQSVLVATLNLDRINEQFSRESLPPGSCLSMWDRNGIIVAHYPDPTEYIGKSTPQRDILPRLLEYKGDGMIEAPDPDGTTRYFAVEEIYGNTRPGNLYLSVGIPKSTVLANVKRTSAHTYLILSIFALLMILLAWTGVDRFVLRGLNSLLSTTKELAKGKVNARTDMPYDTGELGQLAEAFDLMAEKVEKRENGLRNAISDLNQIIQAATDGLCIIDKDYNILRMNSPFAKTTEMTPAETVGRKCYDVIHNQYCDTAKCAMKRILGGRERVEYDLDKTLKNGSVISFIMTAAPYRDERGNIIGILENLKDITGRREMELKMARYECMNAMGEIAAKMGHEIRNPLTTVRGLLQLMSMKEDFGKHTDRFELMISEIDRTNTILTDFLSITRSKPTQLKKQSLNDVIETMFPLIQSDAIVEGKQIILDLSEIPDIPLDERSIRQLILNLVRNGLEAMSVGGELVISTFLDEDVVLAIRDQGCGIDSELLPKLGTPFLTTKEKGTGLGLSISYNIADSHNADIDVESDENGTDFYVRFKNPDAQPEPRVRKPPPYLQQR